MMVLPPPAETEDQPPSGGCVLKPKIEINPFFKADQPPSGGCVLKRDWSVSTRTGGPSRLQAAVC